MRAHRVAAVVVCGARGQLLQPCGHPAGGAWWVGAGGAPAGAVVGPAVAPLRARPSACICAHARKGCAKRRRCCSRLCEVWPLSCEHYARACNAGSPPPSLTHLLHSSPRADDQLGSFGFILNRPSAMRLCEAQANVTAGEAVGVFGQQQLQLGGPVHQTTLTLLHSYGGLAGANRIAEVRAVPRHEW